MSLATQLKTINGSAVAVTVAQAYLVGYCIPIGTMVVPHFITTDYVGAAISFWHDCLMNPAWLFIFFKSTMNCGISFALGALMKTNAFDKLKTAFSTPATTITDFSKLPSTKPNP